MPLKPLNQRVKRAKKEGRAASLTDVDLGEAPRASNHALKKSRHVRRMITLTDRSVSLRKPPGQGAGRKRFVGNVREEDVRELTATDRVRTLLGRGSTPVATKRLPPSRVNGRKKDPSRMNIKARGGPHERSRLHGA